MKYVLISGLVLLVGFLVYLWPAVYHVLLIHKVPLLANVVLSVVGFFAVCRVSQQSRQKFINAHLFGIDLNKLTTKRDKNGALRRPIEGEPVPEAMGVICAAGYIVCMSLFLPFPFNYSVPLNDAAMRGRLTAFVAALLTVSLMAFLGFVDNVLDLRWRHKILLPAVATLPLILVYIAEIGVTSVFIPKPLHWVIGSHLDLGVVAFTFILMGIAIIWTNLINILAGVNGLEVGQSVVVGVSMLVYNLVQLARIPVQQEYQLFSIYLLLPFVGTSCGLLRLNWFPAKIFVGDTYCYFAGMTFAVAGILGHYSKTLFLFFIPQGLNAVYSLPQLIRVIPCPRHRMPTLDISACTWEGDTLIPIPQCDTVLENSFTEFEPAKLSKLGSLCFRIIRTLRLARIIEDGDRVRMSNLTIINLVLYICGPMREDKLTVVLLTFQVACSLLAFWIRFSMSAWFYDVVE
eukprot:GEMP01031881.1.p1 GENE.GEMP01031881.1~~GEMP01031881.1.p1  ORF type:complete len:460 (+),score=72.42 GEMP01031881.1:40-1419(+)